MLIINASEFVKLLKGGQTYFKDFQVDGLVEVGFLVGDELTLDGVTFKDKLVGLFKIKKLSIRGATCRYFDCSGAPVTGGLIREFCS